jgi:hypothetical protein
MSLSDRQIERYSRQIIVPGFGARGQERLLASRLRLVGTPDDMMSIIPYLAGAGFGAISIGLATGHLDFGKLAGLNSDCSITIDFDGSASDLELILIGDSESLEAVRAEISSAPRRLSRPSIVARLDHPARIAITPAPPPCPRCVGILDGPFVTRDSIASVVAMAAAVEAIKLAAGIEKDPAPESALITFDNYDSRVSSGNAIAAKSDQPCSCGVAVAAVVR